MFAFGRRLKNVRVLLAVRDDEDIYLPLVGALALQ